jgi:hypothetical protein
VSKKKDWRNRSSWEEKKNRGKKVPPLTFWFPSFFPSNHPEVGVMGDDEKEHVRPLSPPPPPFL